MFGRNKDKGAARAQDQKGGIPEGADNTKKGNDQSQPAPDAAAAGATTATLQLDDKYASLHGISVQPATFELENGQSIQLGHVVATAFEAAQPITVDEWNALPDEEREFWIQEVVDNLPLKVGKVQTGIKPFKAREPIEYNPLS